VAVTPIQLDLTAQRLLKRLEGWTWPLAETPATPELEGTAKPKRVEAPKSPEAQLAEINAQAGGDERA
jgi:hypothetical protein